MRKLRPIVLKNHNGLEVTLLAEGASIYSIIYKGKYMTLTPMNEDDFYKSSAYYGKSIGPIANRIKDGVITIENKKYLYDINEGNNSLHSGKEGISNRVFQYKEERNKVIFYLEDINIRYEIDYEINDNDELLLSLKAEPKEDLPIALTNHTYFCLGDSNLDNLSLKIPAHHFIETESTTLMPLKERDIIPCLDFSKGKNIMQDINDPYLQNHRSLGYDHCFLLNNNSLILENKEFLLEIKTDYKAIQIYSDNYADNIKMFTSDELIHRGLAIEPEDNLLDRPFMKKGSIYRRTIKYTFKKKEEF